MRNQLLTEKSSGNSIDTLGKKNILSRTWRKNKRERMEKPGKIRDGGLRYPWGKKTSSFGGKNFIEHGYVREAGYGNAIKKEHRVSRAIDYNMFSKVKNLAEKWIRVFYSVYGF